MPSDRDILVMFRHNIMSQQEMDREVMLLNELLFDTERPDSFAAAHEVLDLNRYRVINDLTLIKKMIRQKKINGPFIFLNNKN